MSQLTDSWRTVLRRAVNATLATGLLFLSTLGSAVTEFRVSVGSYANLENARNALAEADATLGPGHRVLPAKTATGQVYRVVSRAYGSRASAQAAVLAAKRANVSGAWIVTTERSGTSRPANNFATNLATNAGLPQPSPERTQAPSARPETTAPSNTVALNGAPGIQVRLEDQPSANTTPNAIGISKTTEAEAAIKVDGRLDEAIWSTLPNVGNFVVLEPDTLADTPHATNIKLAYTDKGLYLAADLEQPKGTLIRRLSGRDVYAGLNRDSINLTLDTSGEGRYGFWFGINLGDSLMDGTVLPEYRFSNEWDGPWRGASVETDTGWSAEFFIPWSAVSMPNTKDVRNMGIYLSRKVAYLDERWGWPALPSTKPKFLSVLQPVELRGINPRQQYNIYPFASVTQDEIDDETRYQIGADLFWRPSSNFQLNATLNPDFGNVESDDVVVNLSATETFFPEKRLFFVEGQEIFVASPRADTRSSGVGLSGPPTTLINTRRIGGSPQAPVLNAGQEVSDRESRLPAELLGAAKATGQFGNFRYGFLTAFEDEVRFKATQNGQDLLLTQDGSDYGVARFLYENNTKGYKAIGILATAVQHYDRDAYVTGLDWHLLTEDGKLKVDGQAFRSDLDGVKAGYGGFLDFEYTFRQGVRQRLGIDYFDKYVDINDLGYQARNAYRQIRTAHTRTSSNLSWARNNQFDIRGAVQENSDGYFSRGAIAISNRATFKNLTTLTGRVNFGPGRYDDLNGFGNGIFRTEETVGASLKFESNTTKALNYSFEVGYTGEDLGGDSYNYKASVNWRPLDGLNLSAGMEYKDRHGWLLHQEDRNMTTFDAKGLIPNLTAEYFLSAKQHFKISVQWVGIEAEEDEFYLIPTTPGDLIPTISLGRTHSGSIGFQSTIPIRIVILTACKLLFRSLETNTSGERPFAP
ncbi:MAG: DUF5916 domain-containing protein [Gammaproteobacteria bacterium]